MAENSRSIAKYRPVSSAEPYTVSGGRNQEPLYTHDRSTSYEGHEPADHRPSYFIPRKPLPYHDSAKDTGSVNTRTKMHDPDVVRQSPTASSKHGRAEVFSIWWLEMICSAIFCGALIAIAATVYSYEGRPLPEWPYHLTINTLIAIYVVILKAALLLVIAQGLGQLKWRWFDRERPLSDLTSFDDASRGAWGSLSLLWTLKGRHIVASCGALVTVAALFIDPFAQQVISTTQCTTDVQSSQAMIPRTNFYNEAGPHVGAGATALPVDVQRVINAGIFNPGAEVPYGCPSGNCTFPTIYHSVGYCGSCEDVTDYLQITNEVVQGGPNYTNVSLPGFWDVTDRQYYTSPVTAILNDAYSDQLGNVSHPGTAYLVMDYGAREVVTAFVRNEISDSCSNSTNISWGCATEGFSGAGAAVCTISPCVLSYRASITAGSLFEQMASASNLQVWDNLNYINGEENLFATINLACLSPSTQSRLSKLDFKREDNGWLSTPNLTVAPPDATDTELIPIGDYWIPTGNKALPNISISRECVYVYDTLFTDGGIQAFLSTYLNGTVGLASEGGYPYDYAGAPQLLAIYNETYLTFDALNSTFANISNSLTTHIRQNGAQNFSSPAYGLVTREQTCVRVRWAWLAFPTTIVGLTLLFLTGMIVQTRRGEGRRHDWKSEPLALMFHRLDDDTIKALGTGRLVKKRDMQDTAERVRARLAETPDGWCFLGSGCEGAGKALNADDLKYRG